MNIVYSSSDAFSGIFAASVTSLFETNRELDMTVYLIDENISEKNRERITQIGKAYGRQIKLIPMISLETLAEVNIDVPKGCSLSTFGRLFLPTMLPNNVDRALYIDCDTIIRKPLGELWNTDISGYMAAMVNDGHSMAYRKVLGLKTEGTYFSAGVMLIDLKQWRERGIEKEFVRYIHGQGGYVPIGDQGVINAVCDGEIMQLPLKYNVYTAIVAFDYPEFKHLRSLQSFYCQKEYEDARDNPVIIHYMNNFLMPIRPWQKGSDHPYAIEFLQYRECTPWRDEPIQESECSTMQRMYTNFCHAVPRGMMIDISAFIHEHIIALKHNYKKQEAIRKMNRAAGGVHDNVVFVSFRSLDQGCRSASRAVA